MDENMRQEKRDARNATRRLLWQWGNTVVCVRRLEQERTAFWEMANDARQTLRSPDLSGMPRGGKTCDLSDVVERVMEESERYAQQVVKINAEIDDALRLRNCISDCVARLTPIQEKVVGYRYADGHSWRYIAMRMNYSEDNIRKIDAQAVDAISAMIHISVQPQTRDGRKEG